MRVGTRITAVTSALVASTLAMYASYDLRDRAQERRLRLESETRAHAVALRTQLELQGVGRALAQAEVLSQELSEAVDGMRVWILPASAANRPPPPKRSTPAPSGAAPESSRPGSTNGAAAPSGSGGAPTGSKPTSASGSGGEPGSEAASRSDRRRQGAERARHGAGGPGNGASGAGIDGAATDGTAHETDSEPTRSPDRSGTVSRTQSDAGRPGTATAGRTGTADRMGTAADRTGTASDRARVPADRRTANDAKSGGAQAARTGAGADRSGAGANRSGAGADGNGAGADRNGAGAAGEGGSADGDGSRGSRRGSDAPAGTSRATGRGGSGVEGGATGPGGAPEDPSRTGRRDSSAGARSGSGSRDEISSQRSGPSSSRDGTTADRSATGASPDVKSGPAGASEGSAREGAAAVAAAGRGSGSAEQEAPGASSEEPAEVPDVGPAIERLRDLVQARPIHVSVDGDDAFAYALPLRQASRLAPDGYEVAGSIDVTRSLAPLQRAWREDLVRTLPILAIIVALVVTAVMLFTRSLVSRPIEKLLAGIDDVARGDLSRVLLSEREDEIGALAARFNEMTYSLRESRAETERQNADKTKLEERLFQTEKLATIGQLAAEIAHEVGTPLNVIVGRSRAMAKKAGDPEAVAKNAEIVAEQASRITRIIQRLLDTARRKVGAPEVGPVDLNRIAATTMDFLEGKFAAARVTRALVRAEALPAVKGDSDQLQQVLINLLMNAIEAMPRGGQIRVETSLVTRRRPGLEVAPEQEVVVVEVADTGVGIPPDQRDRVFEPFYTTKEGRGGTGLGLAVSHGIIKEHDGWMEVEDAHGGPGSVFRVCLPAAGETG